MKKSNGLKIRKVWVIKPKSRVKSSDKRTMLAKIKDRELKQQSGDLDRK